MTLIYCRCIIYHNYKYLRILNSVISSDVVSVLQ